MTVPVYGMTDTWNSGATVFTAVQMNVTNTASAAGSMLADFQVGGTTAFNFGPNFMDFKLGNATHVGSFNLEVSGEWNLNIGLNFGGSNNARWTGQNMILNNAGPTYFVGWRSNGNGVASWFSVGRSVVFSAALGTELFYFIVDTGVLGFGGTTSSFPGLVNSGSELRCMLADNSAFANFAADTVRGVAGTFASVPASPIEGMLIAVTDSTTNVWGATITGGGANHVLAYYNGTNWTVAGK